MCTSAKKETWYKFNGTRLKMMDEAVEMRQDIDEKFVPMFEQKRTHLSATIRLNDENQRKEAELHIGLITTFIHKMKLEGFSTTVIKACKARRYLHVNDFSQIADMDPGKIGWANLVTEVCGNQVYPRPGKPEDFITKSTLVDFDDSLDEGSSKVQELMKWLQQVFVDPELLVYFLKDVASFLKGGNGEKFFRVWTGATDNSKSMIVKLIQQTLGEYTFDIPPSALFPTKGGGEGPSPVWAQAKGGRVGWVSEPDGNDELGAGIIKRQTGGDRFFARMCHENGGSITASHKLVLICNRIPEVPGIDKAGMNRFLILPFKSTWVDNPPESIEEQYRLRLFKKDEMFDSKIPKLVPALAWLMQKYFNLYSTEGLRKPDIVREYIDQHWNERDIYKIFIEENVKRMLDERGEPNSEMRVTTGPLYTLFKSWHKDQFPQKPIPTMPKFRDEMQVSSRMGPMKSNRWIGYEITTLPFDVPQVSATASPLRAEQTMQQNGPPKVAPALSLRPTISSSSLTLENLRAHDNRDENHPEDEVKQQDDLKSNMSGSSMRSVSIGLTTHITQWLKLNCVVSQDRTYRIVTQQLYLYYCNDCKPNNTTPLNLDVFGKVLTSILPDHKLNTNPRSFWGVHHRMAM
jgi:phage/plasmid-associated DNA primase